MPSSRNDQKIIIYKEKKIEFIANQLGPLLRSFQPSGSPQVDGPHSQWIGLDLQERQPPRHLKGWDWG